MTRSDLLQQLLESPTAVPLVAPQLSELGWDVPEELVTLDRQHCERVLELHLQGKLSEAEVETWADAVECREDVAMRSVLVADVLHELANPLLTYPLSESRSHALLAKLRNES